MTRHFCRLYFLFLSLTLMGIVANGQGNLTARAGNGQPGATGSEESDRTRDGLLGPVRRVRTEVVKVSMVDGKLTDNGKRLVLEMAEYDLKGTKTQNQYFPISGAPPTGREVYKYDDKGNISEMTLMGADGSLISKEGYKYEYDSLGNWVKMTTSVAVVENGRISFEPTEVTYRGIFYYLDASMTRMLEPAGSASTTAKAGNIPAADGNNLNAKSNSSNTESKSVNALPPSIRSVRLTSQPVQPLMPDLRNVNFVASQRVSVAETDAPPAPRSATTPVSGGVLNGQAISLPSPAYPDAARRMQVVGQVRVEVVLDENGKVVSARALSGPAMLRDVSVQAAYRAKFTPTKLSGQPVKVTGMIVYNFTAPR